MEQTAPPPPPEGPPTRVLIGARFININYIIKRRRGLAQGANSVRHVAATRDLIG